MATDAPVSISIRIDKTTRDLLKEIARRERRSMNKTVEWLIAEHCDKNDIVAPTTKRATEKAKK
jgi:hypothetical protein